MLNVTTVAAIIAAIAAIVAPTVTALINQIGTYQLKKSEWFRDEKIKAYNEFLSASCEFPLLTTNPSRIEAAAYRALLFSSPGTTQKINRLTKALIEFAKNGYSSDMAEANSDVLLSMQAEIQKYHK